MGFTSQSHKGATLLNAMKEHSETPRLGSDFVKQQVQ